MPGALGLSGCALKPAELAPAAGAEWSQDLCLPLCCWEREQAPCEAASPAAWHAECSQPGIATGCSALCLRHLFCEAALEDYVERSFRGTVKAALSGIVFHYLLTSFDSVQAFLPPAHIWLTIAVLIHAMCSYQTASALSPPQQQKCESSLVCWVLVSFS